MDKIIFLNLDIVDLYGWEIRKPKKKIDNIIKGISEGVEFDPVDVYKIDNRTYYIAHDWGKEGYEGGHSRALAHYKKKQSLKCRLKGIRSEIDVGDHMPFNIKNIKTFVGEEADRKYNLLKKRDPNYK